MKNCYPPTHRYNSFNASRIHEVKNETPVFHYSQTECFKFSRWWIGGGHYKQIKNAEMVRALASPSSERIKELWPMCAERSVTWQLQTTKQLHPH